MVSHLKQHCIFNPILPEAVLLILYSVFMKTITITVVCFISMCATAFSQNKADSNNNSAKRSNLFPVAEMDITNPQSVILYNANKEKKLIKAVSVDMNKYNYSYYVIVPVSYYSKEKKYNLIN